MNVTEIEKGEKGRHHHQRFRENDAEEPNEISMRQEMHGIRFLDKVTDDVTRTKDFHGHR